MCVCSNLLGTILYMCYTVYNIYKNKSLMYFPHRPFIPKLLIFVFKFVVYWSRKTTQIWDGAISHADQTEGCWQIMAKAKIYIRPGRARSIHNIKRKWNWSLALSFIYSLWFCFVFIFIYTYIFVFCLESSLLFIVLSLVAGLTMFLCLDVCLGNKDSGTTRRTVLLD